MSLETLNAVVQQMREFGANRIYAKQLALNDNSKQQVYLSSGFSVLNILPYGQIRHIGKLPKADVNLYWMNSSGSIAQAPNTKMILYPQYPEVRLSGFLQNCEYAPSELMGHPSGRIEGRLLVLGVVLNESEDRSYIIAFVVAPNDPIAGEFEAIKADFEQSGVFYRIPLSYSQAASFSDRDRLVDTLRDIHLKGWLDSQRLSSEGLVPCRGTNCGGYTLEAQLGVLANSYSEPDFLGWEVKQYAVVDFDKPEVAKSPITLMTPEPTGGFYKEKGVIEFVRRFGYPDKHNRPDRFNFGGIYRAGRAAHKDTGLTLDLRGFDPEKGKITDLEHGGIFLIHPEDGIDAAMWNFTSLIDHWKRKHAQAAYVPSQSQSEPRQQYRYGHTIRLGQGTDFLNLLMALYSGMLYYDPGIKVERFSTEKPVTKRRSQFRIRSQDLERLYTTMESVYLLDA